MSAYDLLTLVGPKQKRTRMLKYLNVNVKALMFSNLTTFINIPLPFIPVNGYEFEEGDLIFYNGETPDGMGGNLSGDYTGSGVYSFHDNGDATGTLTRAPGWEDGAVIDRGTVIHIGQGGSDGGTRFYHSFFEINPTVTIGAGDPLPLGPRKYAVADYTIDSGIYKRVVNTIAVVDTPLTGVAPGTIIGGFAIGNGNTAFLTNQTTPAENGVYTYSAAGQSFSRRDDFLNNDFIPNGTLIYCNGGDYFNKIIRIPTFTVGQASGALLPNDAIDQAYGIPYKESPIVLSPTNISDQYVDLSYVAKTDSLRAHVRGTRTPMFENDDYTLSIVGGVTRFTFAGDFATGGATPLISGDDLRLEYVRTT